MTKTPAHDVFISHAFEDKQAFANELALELTKAGLKVWYSGFELKLGDSIAGSVNKGLKDAAFGIVVVSPVYLEKQWTINELNALFAQEAGENRILPILHDITVDEIKERFPILADRYMISSGQGMSFVVNKVLQAMARTGKHADQRTVENKHDHENPNRVASNNSTNNNTNNNSSSSNVTVNTNSGEGGGGKLAVVILVILAALAIYFFYENSGTDPVNKEHSIPSNSN